MQAIEVIRFNSKNLRVNMCGLLKPACPVQLETSRK
jgi:hypothetical protein